MESRAPAAARNAEPSPQDGRGRPHSAQALPGGPDLRPRGRPGAARRPGTSGAYPAPPQPPLERVLCGTFSSADLAEGSLGRLPTQACAATPLLQAARRAQTVQQEGPRSGGWGEEAQARGATVARTERASFPF